MDAPSFGGWRACDACGEAIARIEECVLTVSPDLLRQRREALSAETPPGAAGGASPRADTGLIPWDWGHRDCFPPRDPEFAIDGPRLATLAGVTLASFELLARPWFAETAWEDAIRRFYALPTD